MRRKFTWIALLCVLALCAPAALASVNGFNPDEAADVNRRTGNASPGGGAGSATATGAIFNAQGQLLGSGTIVTNQNNSQVDNYVNQDEQINLTEKSGVVKVLRVNQKNLINDYVTELIPVTNAKGLTVATELLRAIRTITGKEGGRAEAVRDKVGKKAFLQVIVPEFQLPFVREAVKALDVDWLQDSNDGFQVAYYVAKNRDAAAINVIATPWGGGDGATTVDTSNNVIIRRTEPFRKETFLYACKQLDIAPNQMTLEGAIYEVNKYDDLKLGLDYIAWKNGPGRSLFDLSYSKAWSKESWNGATSVWTPVAPRTVPVDDPLTAYASQWYGYANALVTSAYYDFQAAKGNTRVICRPKIIARSNTPATFTATDQIVGFQLAQDSTPDAIANGVQGANTNGPNDYQRGVTHNRVAAGNVPITTGCELTVTPQIGTETSEVLVSAVFRTIAGTNPANGAPIINTRQITTTVRVADGKPFVIAGLKRSEKLHRYAGIPGLDNIKVVKYIFGGKEDSDRNTDFIIVLTPKVVVGAASDMYTAEDTDTRDMVVGKKKVELPTAPWGYDQWMLDERKTGSY